MAENTMNTNAIYQRRRVWQPQHIQNIEIAYRDSSSFNLFPLRTLRLCGF